MRRRQHGFDHFGGAQAAGGVNQPGFAALLALVVLALLGGLDVKRFRYGFVGTEDWFNTPGDKPLTLSGLHGHVVIVDFWTYTCINCIRTLPFIEGLYKTYHRYGLEIVGVEAPEFEFEKEAGNVAQARPPARYNSDARAAPVTARALAGPRRRST